MIRAYRVRLETRFVDDPRVREHTRRVVGEDLTEAAARKLALRRERAAHANLPRRWWETIVTAVAQERAP